MTEWLWVAVAVAFVGYVHARKPGGVLAPCVLAGILIGFGCSTKVTLVGAAPILAVAVMQGHQWQKTSYGLLVMAGSSLATYAALTFLYMISWKHGLEVIRFQISFFQSPNHSSQYNNGWDALINQAFYPFMMIALAVSMIVAVSSRNISSFITVICTILWLCLYGVLISARPHGTSVASAFISCYGMLGFLAINQQGWRRNASIVIPLSILMVGGFATGWVAPQIWMSFRNSSVTTEPTVLAQIESVQQRYRWQVWFVPDNYWNAGLPVEVFGFNGGLGWSGWKATDAGPDFLGMQKAFHSAFPGAIIANGNLPWDLEGMKKLYRLGYPILWTRRFNGDTVYPAQFNSAILFQTLDGIGAKYKENPFLVNQEKFLFGLADPTEK